MFFKGRPTPKVFATAPRRLSADEVARVAGGEEDENQFGGKQGSGQDNQAKPGFYH